MTILRSLALGCGVAGLLAGCGPQSRFVQSHLSDDPHAVAQAHWQQVRGDVKRRLAEQALSIGELREARSAALEAASLNETDPAAHRLLAQIELNEGNLAAAARSAEVATRLSPQDPETAYLAGQIAERYERFDEARTFYDLALERRPDDVQFLAAAAQVRVKCGKPIEAIEMLEARLEDFESNVELRCFLGATYRLMEMKEGAVRAYGDALRLAPDDAALRAQYGETLEWAGKSAEAIEILPQCIANLSEAEAEAAPRLRKSLTRALLSEGRFLDAAAAIRPVVAADGNDAEGWALLVRAAIAQGDYATGREAAEQLGRLQTEDDSATLIAALCAMRMGDADGAMRGAAAAIERDPHDTTALCVLAAIQKSKGNSAAAERLVAHALRVDPGCQTANALQRAMGLAVAPPAAAPLPMATSQPVGVPEESAAPLEEIEFEP